MRSVPKARGTKPLQRVDIWIRAKHIPLLLQRNNSSLSSGVSDSLVARARRDSDCCIFVHFQLFPNIRMHSSTQEDQQQQQQQRTRSQAETANTKKSAPALLPGVDFKGGDLPGVGGLYVNNHEVYQVSTDSPLAFSVFRRHVRCFFRASYGHVPLIMSSSQSARSTAGFFFLVGFDSVSSSRCSARGTFLCQQPYSNKTISDIAARLFSDRFFVGLKIAYRAGRSFPAAKYLRRL